MNTQEAIEILTDKRHLMYLKGITTSMEDTDTIGFISELTDAITLAIQALEQTQWISVEDDLPKKEAKYLVRYLKKNKECFNTTNYTIANDNYKVWDLECIADVKVTHWMSLPPVKE